MAVFISHLFLLFQRVIPKRLVTALVYRLARIRIAAIKNFFIRTFLRFYDVDLDEISKTVPDDFECFNDFFTRELKEGLRQIDMSTSVIVSPADGFISAAGRIQGNAVFQAKGYEYSLEELLATDLAEARNYYDGRFATIYLAPFNYHRVHAPLDAELFAARFVPGTLFSVSDTTVAGIRGIFARNERLICHFRTATGTFVLILVGALNVGSITTQWTGELRPRKGNVVEEIDFTTSNAAAKVSKGDLIGWFNMGSTVILLLPPEMCEWRPGLDIGAALRMGESIGRIGN
jgi:phosphatidylserine decarboxylase